MQPTPRSAAADPVVPPPGSEPVLTLHLKAIAGSFIVVMILGLAEMSGAIRQYGDLKFPTGWNNFRTGLSTTTLEKQIDQKLPDRSALIATANGLRYALLRGSADEVRVGRDGWLFLTEELRYDAQGERQLDARADLLAGVARKLRERGVSLVVALVPDKARVYAAHLDSSTYPSYNAARYQAMLDALRRRQVQAVDLLAPLVAASARTDVYYRTDTHWNVQGALVAAQQIANAAQSIALQPSTTFQTDPSGPMAPRTGDLIRMMGLDGAPRILRPADDTEGPVKTQAQASTQAPVASLFGDTVVPVTLLGTSYSQRGNFHGALEQALSAQVLNMSQDGGGFLQAAGRYFADDAFRNSPPRLIVWELPERFLTQPLGQETRWLQDQGW